MCLRNVMAKKPSDTPPPEGSKDLRTQSEQCDPMLFSRGKSWPYVTQRKPTSSTKLWCHVYKVREPWCWVVCARAIFVHLYSDLSCPSLLLYVMEWCAVLFPTCCILHTVFCIVHLVESYIVYDGVGPATIQPYCILLYRYIADSGVFYVTYYYDAMGSCYFTTRTVTVLKMAARLGVLTSSDG